MRTAFLALLLSGCRCGFDSSTLDELICSSDAECSPDQDCIAQTCEQRRCREAMHCGTGFGFTCDEEGFCVVDRCPGNEDCGPGLVCAEGYCRASPDAGAGCAGDECDAGLDASSFDAAAPDAAGFDAALPDASTDASLDAAIDAALDASAPDAAVGCGGDEDCDDGVFCNGRETCDDDGCAPGADPCPPGGPCATSECDEDLDECGTVPLENGLECDDDETCTFGDECQDGVCASEPYSCDDGIPCTADQCDGQGGCANPLEQGSCLIGDICWASGEANPNAACQSCDPATDTSTWTVDCGACPAACGALERCLDSRCAPAPFGSGADGDLAVGAAEILSIDAAATPASGSAGDRVVVLADATGFAAGRMILLHQTQGTGAGVWELARIGGLAGQVATLNEPLRHGYSSSGADRAQAVVVREYAGVTVDGTLTARAWDGGSGGILAFAASGSVSVGGLIDMAGRGFRGSGHGCFYQCQTGIAGESTLGPGAVGRAANGAGGGGGTGGQDCGMGGGGGHGTSGGLGGDGVNVFGGCGLDPDGGEGGGTIGGADLDAEIFFGGAGGEGGGDEDGAYPGAGGNGGGIVVILASAVDVWGSISASGRNGNDGNSSECGGGCGMSGGGGGAGGAIRIIAGTADLGEGLVRSLGGAAGLCTCGNAVLSGVGGAGRIHVTADVLDGTTDPP